jgi:predicted nucleic acid-binding protein
MVRISLDTNILLRGALRADPQHPRVSEALARLAAAGWELCIGLQNVVEFWVVATRPTDVNGFGLSPERGRAEVDLLLSTYALMRDPPDLLERWLDLCTRYAVSGRPAHDARLVALMLAHGVTRLLTLNPADFARYSEITCLSPEDV